MERDRERKVVSEIEREIEIERERLIEREK